MEISQIFGYLAGLIFAISAGWYTYDVARKKVNVSLATFTMLSLIGLSQLVALIDERVWAVVPFTLVGLVASTLISLFSIRNHKFYFKVLDKVSLVGALIGYAAWQLTNNAALNIYILSLTNLIVFIPLIAKAFKYPDTETKKPWALNLLASSFLMLTVDSISPVVWAFPLRQFVCSVLMNLALCRKARSS